MRFLPPKKTYVVYYRRYTWDHTQTMVVNARSVAKAIKIAYKVFNPYLYQITDIVDAEKVFDILRMGNNKR